MRKLLELWRKNLKMDLNSYLTLEKYEIKWDIFQALAQIILLRSGTDHTSPVAAIYSRLSLVWTLDTNQIRIVSGSILNLTSNMLRWKTRLDGRPAMLGHFQVIAWYILKIVLRFLFRRAGIMQSKLQVNFDLNVRLRKLVKWTKFLI